MKKSSRLDLEDMVMCRIVAISMIMVFSTAASSDTDFASGMMRATFRIAGPNSVGTAFIVGRPAKSAPGKAYIVLVTAAHVLESIKGEVAVVFCRKRSDETFVRQPVNVRIREGEKCLWKKHPKADVAVMYFSIPEGIDRYVIGPGTFITDAAIRNYEVHPGDRLFALGYPFGVEANSAGFPILRSGVVASYPVTRSGGGDTLLYDFEVFPGNSGGPVFLIEEIPVYGGKIQMGGGYRGLIGIVSRERKATEKVTSLTETREVQHALHIAEVIHASVIKEAIDMLPDGEQKDKKEEKDDGSEAPAPTPEKK